MATDGDGAGWSSDRDATLANVALLYYGEGLTQEEIAKRMGVSRPTIVNMVRESRRRGIVEIRVDGTALSSCALSRRLKRRFGLADAYVSRSRSSSIAPPTRAESLRQLARVAGAAIFDVVREGDAVGVAWGETVKAVADVTPRQEVSDVTVCQMIGSMVSDRVATSEGCVVKIANAFNAACFTLHAPAVLSSAELAASLRREPTIAVQLQRLEALDVAIYSVGNTDPDTHLIAAGIATESDVEAARQRGAKGIVCCRYVDADGRKIPLPPDERVIAIDVDQLGNAKRKFVVIAGEDRKDAALALLNGGLVTHLCVDVPLARALMAEPAG